MPVHLAPLSRRQFLGRALGATAAVALQRASLGAQQKRDPDSWALLADTHLAGDRTLKARGINMAEHFETASADLISLPEHPAGVFIVGDCAYNSGESRDYGTLAEMLEPICASQMPVHLALGNHDNRERFWAAFEQEKAAKRPLADRQVALLRTRRANWFMLDSLEQTLSTPGLVGSEQLDWLSKSLDANPTKPAIVLVHHNPGIEGGNFGLKDTVAFLDIIRPRRQVKAYIFGHTHNWHIEQDDSGLHFVNLPPVSYVFQEGLPSGWVHARLQNDGIELELWCTDKARKDHRQKRNLRWRV